MWVMEYGITHHRMVLALHRGAYPIHEKLLCLDCVRFEGNLQGGPYRLVLGTIEVEGVEHLELHADHAAFRLVCGSMRFINTQG